MKLRHFILTLAAIYALLLLFCSVGCKTKQKHKEQHTQKVEIESIKNTLTTTTIDTTIHLNGAQATVAAAISSLVDGKPIIAQNNGTVVSLQYDSATQTVRATGTTLPQDIPVKAEKVTATSEKGKVKIETKDQVKSTTVESDIWGNVQVALIIICVLAIIGFAIWVWWKLSRHPPLI